MRGPFGAGTRYRVNVADESEVSGAMTRVASDFDRLDGLVNNAGIVRDALLVKVKDGAVVGRMTHGAVERGHRREPQRRVPVRA